MRAEKPLFKIAEILALQRLNTLEPPSNEDVETILTACARLLQEDGYSPKGFLNGCSEREVAGKLLLIYKSEHERAELSTQIQSLVFLFEELVHSLPDPGECSRGKNLNAFEKTNYEKGGDSSLNIKESIKEFLQIIKHEYPAASKDVVQERLKKHPAVSSFFAKPKGLWGKLSSLLKRRKVLTSQDINSIAMTENKVQCSIESEEIIARYLQVGKKDFFYDLVRQYSDELQVWNLKWFGERNV